MSPSGSSPCSARSAAAAGLGSSSASAYRWYRSSVAGLQCQVSLNALICAATASKSSGCFSKITLWERLELNGGSRYNKVNRLVLDAALEDFKVVPEPEAICFTLHHHEQIVTEL